MVGHDDDHLQRPLRERPRDGIVSRRHDVAQVGGLGIDGQP